jgi:hypothetical protein
MGENNLEDRRWRAEEKGHNKRMKRTARVRVKRQTDRKEGQHKEIENRDKKRKRWREMGRDGGDETESQKELPKIKKRIGIERDRKIWV